MLAGYIYGCNFTVFNKNMNILMCSITLKLWGAFRKCDFNHRIIKR